MFVAKAMVLNKMVGSLGEARRTINQRGVKVNGKIVMKPSLRLNKGDKIQVGETRVVVHDPSTTELVK